MPFDASFIQHFHFLRPEWALLLLPWLFILWVMRRRQVENDRFGGIIASHLLEHLRVTRFSSHWMNPQSFTRIVMALLFIVLMGPSWRQQPSPLSQDDSALVVICNTNSNYSRLQDSAATFKMHQKFLQISCVC